MILPQPGPQPVEIQERLRVNADLRLMMNSSRARPTPWFGRLAKSKARSGLPTFIMIFTGPSGSLLSSVRCCSKSSAPS